MFFRTFLLVFNLLLFDNIAGHGPFLCFIKGAGRLKGNLSDGDTTLSSCVFFTADSLSTRKGPLGYVFL